MEWGSGATGVRFDRGASGDLQRLVLAMEVEDVLRVAEAVHLAVQGGAGVRRYLEVDELLAEVAARFQAERHYAVPHRRRVDVLGDVLDLVTQLGLP